MSKKLYSTERWKNRILAGQKRELNKLRRRKLSSGSNHYRIATELTYTHLRAPSTFSITKNPEESIGFLNQIESISQSKNIDLDISSVSSLTPDAIAVLIATICKPKFSKRNVRGNLPQDSLSQQILVASGFFDHVKRRVNLPKVLDKGIITQRRSKKVESETAAELIHRGSSILHGRSLPSKPAYRVLIEAMGNTHNHAAGDGHTRETWWATVYVDRKRERICFCFVDTGVGIFKSVKVRRIKRIYNLIRGKTDADLLRDMLEGKVQSSTGLPYRGRGLPSINTLRKRHELQKLIIVTNNVYADVTDENFYILKALFRGTLLYWEI